MEAPGELLQGLSEVDRDLYVAEVIGLMPCRRASSSVGTKSPADRCVGCSGVLVTYSTPVRFLVPRAWRPTMWTRCAARRARVLVHRHGGALQTRHSSTRR